MRSRLAVATVSGKAYYRLVSELKQRKMPFLSLIPGESIPPSIKVVITTDGEKVLIDFPTILVYDVEADPSRTVNEAIRLVQSKETYEEVSIGVDPGKTFGVAVLGDGRILKKEEGLTLEMAVDIILTELKQNPSKSQRVRIGTGIPELAEEIASRLKVALPENTRIEMVSEFGTSTFRGKGFRKKMSDADSAINIAIKNSNLRPRRKAT